MHVGTAIRDSWSDAVLISTRQSKSNSCACVHRYRQGPDSEGGRVYGSQCARVAKMHSREGTAWGARAALPHAARRAALAGQPTRGPDTCVSIISSRHAGR